MHDRLVENDEIDQVRNAELCDCLRKEDIAAAVRLRTSKTDLGYILLGYKRSGNIYTNTDKKLLIISADEIAITLQNALHLREIQNFNRTLQDKVEAATKQLRIANNRLKTLDETKRSIY